MSTWASEFEVSPYTQQHTHSHPPAYMLVHTCAHLRFDQYSRICGKILTLVSCGWGAPRGQDLYKAAGRVQNEAQEAFWRGP